MMDSTQAQRRKAHGYAFLTAFLWSFAFIFIKRIVEELQSFGMSQKEACMTLFQFRITLATLPFLPFLYIHRNWFSKLNKRDYALITVIIFTSTFGYHIPLNIGAQYIPSGFTGLLIGTGPIFAAILAWIILKEQLTIYRGAAVILGFLGVVICKIGQNALQGTHLNAIGTSLVLFAAMNGAIFAIVGRSIRKDCPVEFKLAIAMTGASILMLPIWRKSMLHPVFQLSSLSLIGILFLSASLFLTGILWYKSLKILHTVQVTIYLNAMTALALTWGILFYGEKMNALYIAGAGLIFAAIFLVNYSPRLSAVSAPGNRTVST